MSNENELRSVVIGAGWAAEGHVKALQSCGVNVVAICARKQKIVQAVADRLQVPMASTNWLKTLHDLKPDIVTVATPPSLRLGVVAEAVALGCHILCEKPLATNADEAKQLYDLVKDAGIRHAYAVTNRYDSGVAWVAELLRRGEIGQLREIHQITAVPVFSKFSPWSWWDSFEMGGGSLNNGGTHIFAMLEQITGGKLLNAVGTTQTLRQHAPVVPDIHDFRQVFTNPPTEKEAAQLDWRVCDSDQSYTTVLTLKTDVDNSAQTVSVMSHMNMVAHTASPNNGWFFYGDEGTLVGQGAFSFTVSKLVKGELKPLPTPQHLLNALPQTEDDSQNKWNQLVSEFVTHISNGGEPIYPTFEDGWRYQKIIDSVRNGIPEH